MELTPKTKSKSDKPFTFDRTVRLIITLAITVCAVLLLRKLSKVLLPFFAAWLLAFILEPVVQLNKRLLRAKRRFFPVIVTLLEILAVIATLAIILAPSIANETHKAVGLISDYLNNNPSLPAPVQHLVSDFEIESLLNGMSSGDWQKALTIGLQVISHGLSLIMSLFGFIIMFLYLIFIMLDYDKLVNCIFSLVPAKYRPNFRRVVTITTDKVGHYFRAQFIIASTVGILFAIGFAIIGLPMGIMFGLIIGAMNMVPYLQWLSIPPAALLCLIYSAETGTPFISYFFLHCMMVYVVVQSFQDLVLTPRIMGKAMNLNPAFIFLSLSVWGTLLGFVGFVIGLPLTALILALYKEYVIPYFGTDKATSSEAAPDPEIK